MAAFLFEASLAAAAHGCLCGEAPSVRRSEKWATAIFSAEVVSVTDPCPDDAKRCGCGPSLVELEVLEAWKGVEPGQRRIEVFSANGEACGFPFEVGRRYLVYAAPDPPPNWMSSFGSPVAGLDVLSVSVCSRTRELDSANRDRRKLGPPR